MTAVLIEPASKDLSAGGQLLRVRDLEVQYLPRRPGAEPVPALKGVSLDVAPREVVALVGESGSGKSTLAHAILGSLAGNAQIVGGSVHLGTTRLDGLSERALTRIRGRQIAFVPQDPMVGLNPLHKVGRQVAEPLVIHRLLGRSAAREEAARLLARVGIDRPEARLDQYPHQLSGGMRQRVLIAIALAARPRLLVADEPTTALDVMVQKQVLDDISDLTRTDGIAMLIITHDLAVAGDRADRIVVLKDGLIVESGPSAAVLTQPQHAYTKMLLASAPSLSAPRVRRPITTATRAEPGSGAEDPAVVVRDLRKSFRVPHPQEKDRWLPAVDEVNLRVPRGRTLALVGESGSGKTTTARLILGLEKADGGSIQLGGQEVVGASKGDLRRIHARAQLIYQNPYASLNPRLSVRALVTEPLDGFGIGTRQDRRQRFEELMERVGLSPDLHDRRPVELSGGQRQRVAIARALAPDPELVVCDEPVSALDVSVQARILDLLADLQEQLGLSYLFISHDLAVVRQVAHEVAVMHSGRIVERRAVEDLFTSPQVPYTRSLLDAIPGRRLSSTANGRPQ